MRHDHILHTIGRTPAVRLHRLAPSHVEVYVKLEAFNPMGSVKDRMALAVIEDAEQRGVLQPGQTVVEATSGNTGIALAMVCAHKGYPLVVVMAENFSVERRRLMRFLGARVVLTPAELKGSGMLAKARELAAAHGWFLPSQFDNEANALAHQQTTAAEILDDFDDAPLTHFVTGSGTGGTLLGVARELRWHWPRTRIVVCEPDNAPVLASGVAAPPDDADGLPTSHPHFRPHPMQGWTTDFVPALVQRAVAERLVDEIVPVAGDAALRTARELARREGILAGISGGATVAGALQLAATLPAGSRVLAMVPDTGERYLSTPLFADIAAEMDDEEWAISRSSPRARFDAPPAPPTTRVAPPVPAREAVAFVDAAVADTSRPALMFGLRWCEFGWALRRLFERIRAPLHEIHIDDPALQSDGLAGALRAALAVRCGSVTLPQLFVGGRHVGGCTDAIDAWEAGRLPDLLRGAAVPFDAAAFVDTRALLPAWVQPR